MTLRRLVHVLESVVAGDDGGAGPPGFDLRRWPGSLLPTTAYAHLAWVLWRRRLPGDRAAALALASDLALLRLPWPLPRTTWPLPAYWAETFAPVVPLGLAAHAADGRSKGSATACPAWAVGAALLGGAAMVRASGVNLRLVVTGDLARLSPRRATTAASGRALARAAGAIIAPAVEEAFFRGVIMRPGDPRLRLVIESGVVFVLRHALVRGTRRPDRRVNAIRAGDTALLSSLALASRSTAPSTVAHLVNNLPIIVVDAQLAWLWRGEADGPNGGAVTPRYAS